MYENTFLRLTHLQHLLSCYNYLKKHSNFKIPNPNVKLSMLTALTSLVRRVGEGQEQLGWLSLSLSV